MTLTHNGETRVVIHFMLADDIVLISKSVEEMGQMARELEGQLKIDANLRPEWTKTEWTHSRAIKVGEEGRKRINIQDMVCKYVRKS